MLKLGCFIKDTAIVEDVKEILGIMAAEYITNGNRFTLPSAYSFLRKNGIEIDLESAAHVYSEAFSLSDGNFSSKEEVEELAGSDFEETFRNLTDIHDVEYDKKIGRLSPGKSVAKTITDAFIAGRKKITANRSVMAQFEKWLLDAANAVLDRSELNKLPKEERKDFNTVLAAAFDKDQHGTYTVHGYLNSAADVFKELQEEVGKYTKELQKSIDADQKLLSQTKDEKQAQEIQKRIDNNITQLAAYEKYTEAIINRGYNLLLSRPEMRSIIEGTLIKGKFGRTITVGGEEVDILDWKKLTESTGNPDFIKEQITEVLKNEGYTDEQIDRINGALEEQYVDLRASIIEKSANELTKNNKIKPRNTSSHARRMANLYAYGFFDSLPNTYENIIKSVFLTQDIDQVHFDKLKVLASQLFTITNYRVNGNPVDDADVKYALNHINEQVKNLVRDIQSSKNWFLQGERFVVSLWDASTRFLLVTLKNQIQNTFSGLMTDTSSRLLAGLRGEISKEMREINTKAANATFYDIWLNGGLQFGDVQSTFVTRGSLEKLINDWGEHQGYHAIIGALTGRLGLDAADSFFKFRIHQRAFISNLVNILTKERKNEKGETLPAMTKKEAMEYLNKYMTGDSYEKVQQDVRNLFSSLIDKGAKIPHDDFAVKRFTADLIKTQLLIGEKISQQNLEAAWNGAYKTSGYEVGHVANTWLSKIIVTASQDIQGKIDKALKNGHYADAAWMEVAHAFWRNVMVTFVGGATNWIFLRMGRQGLATGRGLFTLMSMDKSGRSLKKLDLTDDIGNNLLEEALTDHQNAMHRITRGLVGGAVAVAMTKVIAKALEAYTEDQVNCEGLTEEKCKDAKLNFWKEKYLAWRKGNRWISKYSDEFGPDYLVYYAANKGKGALSGEFLKDPRATYYLFNSIGWNDSYSVPDKIHEAVKKAQMGKISEAYGLWGEAFGSKLNVPIPYRSITDMKELYKGAMGTLDNQYGPSKSFWEGLFKRGFFEKMHLLPGFVTDPPVSVDQLKGLGKESYKSMAKKLGLDEDAPLEKVTDEFYEYIKNSNGTYVAPTTPNKIAAEKARIDSRLKTFKHNGRVIFSKQYRGPNTELIMKELEKRSKSK